MIRIACIKNPGRPAWLLLWLIAFLLPMVAAAQDSAERCQRCHGESWIGERSPGALAAMVRAPAGGTHQLREADDVAGLYIEPDKFRQSSHGGLSCNQCHPGIESMPHQQQVESLSCAECHTDQHDDLARGMHDPSRPGTPKCADCHGDVHSVTVMPPQRTFKQVTAMVEMCSSCHSEVGTSGFDPAQSFHDSIHGDGIYKKGLVQGPMCTDCHGAHAVLPASDVASPLHSSKVADTCGACHQGVVDTYAGSIHGQNNAAGLQGAATCTSCHHSHGIEQVGPAFLAHVREECSDCHLDKGKSYLRSYHGKAAELGYGEVAVCSSCHGAHDILPASHPDSRVAPENLKETCGACHPGANDNFVQYIAHVDYMDPNEHPAVFYTFWIMTILLCSVLVVFIPHTILWFQRTILEFFLKGPHRHAKRPRMVRRFSLLHRLTHGLIVISFLGLVATGFPLKYSYTDWAHRMTEAFGGIHAMGLLHRIFAILTFVYVVIHVVHLLRFFWKECPRPFWRYIIGPDSMVLTPKDFWDALAMVRWFFWLGPRPRFGRWTYFEKFDYWGEIWGVMVIGGSGLLLWMPVYFTRWLPGWTLNVAMVIHSIEALLAASVIFLVHFFNTHLRPEKFPIDMAMWTGQMSEEELKEERPALYEQLVEANKLEQEYVEPMPMKWKAVGTVLGIAAFLFGIFLIVLAIRTELMGLLS